MTVQDPFSRRKPTKTKQQSFQTIDGNVNTIAEASSRDDNSVAESNAIADFVPSTASIDEGYNKMMSIMKQQELDDARQGIVKPTPIFDTSQQKPAVITEEPPTPLFGANSSAVKDESPAVITEKDKEDEQQPPIEVKDEDVLPLLDSILLKGYASETFSIRGNKITLRTNFYWEEHMIRRLIEENVTDSTLRMTADSVLQQYVLASCLETFGGNHFAAMSQGTPEELRKSLEDRVDFINTLPTVIVWYLNDKRIQLNNKIVYLSENFERLIKAF